MSLVACEHVCMLTLAQITAVKQRRQHDCGFLVFLNYFISNQKHSPAKAEGNVLCKGDCWRLHNGMWEHTSQRRDDVGAGRLEQKHEMCHHAHRYSIDDNTSWHWRQTEHTITMGLNLIPAHI